MNTIQHIFDLNSVGSSGEFLASLECEVENVHGEPKNPKGLWNAHTDGSLRGGKGNAYEWTSAIPLQREALVNAFIELHKVNKIVPGEEGFGHRTSIHVHINCVPVLESHVRNIVLLYALYEEFFFAYVKPERRANIHCVPLTETYLPGIYHKPLDGLYHNWHKYTALNLKRLGDLGTLEFRHHHGTNDAEEVGIWLHLLENLWKLGQKINITTAEVRDKAVLTDWFDMLFFPSNRIMRLKPSMFEIMKNSLIDVKLSTI